MNGYSVPFETDKAVNDTIKRCVRAVKAWDGRKFRIETDWLDTESFVINAYPCNGFRGEEFLDYALPLLFKLGGYAEREFNRSVPEGFNWVLYSDANYWRDDGREVEYYGDWDCVQVCIYLDQK